MSSSKTILGIDPALGTTGYGIIRTGGDTIQLVEAGVVRCDKKQPLECRLHELFCGIKEVVDEFRPDFFAIEQLYSHYERPTTAILMGHARGAIMLAATNAGLKVHSYAATQIKKTLTGNGRAPKDQMQFAVKHQLGLSYVPEPADVADALAIALTHHYCAQAAPVIASGTITASQSTPATRSTRTPPTRKATRKTTTT